MTLLFILRWYLTLQLFALAGLPLAFAWLRGLPSRGYAVAKGLGILLSGVLLWWGSITHFWDHTTGAAISAAGLLFLIGMWAMRDHWHDVIPWWQKRRAFVLLTEGLFAVAFLAWCAVRATQPHLETAGGEKWMEIAFLNAVLRSPTMPPHDPWLSGFAISYYYLGYLLLGMITRLAAVPATIAFNLGNAAWFALAAAAAYGIVYDMSDGKHPGRSFLAPLLLLVTGNGEGLLEVLHARGLLPAAFWSWLDIRSINTPPSPPFSWVPTRFFWWWQASRTLHDYTPWGADQEVIDEFPAFSFILGDMHPHLLALPFVLLAIALALNAWKQGVGQVPAATDSPAGETPTAGKTVPAWLLQLRPWFGYAVVLGALGFLNTWDFPIYWALIVSAAGLHLFRKYSALPPTDATPQTPYSLWGDVIWQLLPEAIVLGVSSIALYLPFWIGLRSQAGGILPNLFNATRLPHFAVMFLPFLVPLLGLILTAARQTQLRWRMLLGWALPILGGLLLLGLIVGLLTGSSYLQALLKGEPIEGLNLEVETVAAALGQRLLNPWTAVLLILGCLILAWALFRTPSSPGSDSPGFPMLLAFLGLGLTLVPEFFFLKDVFSTRMNTIFKFYFQAWVLWSLASAWWLAELPEPHRLFTKAAPYVASLLIAAGCVYTFLAIPARAEEHGTLFSFPPDFSTWTLDGAAWLEQIHPDDWAALQWLNQTIAGRPVILEAPADNNAAYTYSGRVSALTGLPTVLGWAGHELQWRGNYDEPLRREQDLERLFTTTNLADTTALLAQYGVTYIYIGPTEQERYPVEGLKKFGRLFTAVYQNGDVVIYRVSTPRSSSTALTP